MRNIALTLLTAFAIVALAWVAVAQTTPQADGEGVAEPAQRSAHLLDRGTAAKARVPTKGGTTPPSGPTVIAFPGGSPGAVPVPPGFGVLGAVAFPPAGGGLLGNLFLPGTGYPASFLTAGGVSGFDVTGAYAWHLAPSSAASVVRILGAAAVPPPSPLPISPAGPIGPFASAPIPPTGTPAPSGLLSAPGAFPPVRVTPGVSGIFCGLGVGAPGFGAIGAGPAGNGLGGVSGAVLPPLRVAPIPLTAGPFIVTVPAPPAAYIAGCFADSSTTPVELMAFGVE